MKQTHNLKSSDLLTFRLLKELLMQKPDLLGQQMMSLIYQIFMIFYLKKSLQCNSNLNQMIFKKERFYIQKDKRVFQYVLILLLVKLLQLSMPQLFHKNTGGELFIHHLLKLFQMKNIENFLKNTTVMSVLSLVMSPLTLKLVA